MILGFLVLGLLVGIWLVWPDLRVELWLRLDRFDRWRRGQCAWCHQWRLRRKFALPGNVHAFVAIKRGLCYDCAKAWVHASSYSGGLSQADPELLVRLRAITGIDKGYVRQDAGRRK